MGDRVGGLKQDATAFFFDAGPGVCGWVKILGQDPVCPHWAFFVDAGPWCRSV